MKAILYDCRDVGRGCTLRLFDESGMLMQAWMHAPDPVGLAQRIADSVGIELQYVGPPAGREAKPQMTMDPPADYTVPAKRLPAAEMIHARDRNQLALF